MDVTVDHVGRAGVRSDDTHDRLIEYPVAGEADKRKVQALVEDVCRSETEADAADVGHVTCAGKKGNGLGLSVDSAKDGGHDYYVI